MAERLAGGTEQPLGPIGQEKAALKEEADFFNNRAGGRYVGVLTNLNIDIVSILYPQIIDGMNRLYNFIEKESTDPLSKVGFINRHIRNQFTLGRLLSNDEIAQMRDDMQQGQYSEQFEIYRRFRTATSLFRGTGGSQDKRKRFEDYRPINDDTDLGVNKRACLARAQGLQSDLKAVYGEVDPRKALLTELFLSAPFLDTVIRGGDIDEEGRQRHEAYLTEATEFARLLDINKRVATFEEATDKYPVRWTYEPSTFDVPDFDRAYVNRVYAFAGEMIDGKSDLDEAYRLLSETILRRGKIFKATTVATPFGESVQIVPDELLPVTFDDIAGYTDQKKFLQMLLAKTATGDPSIDDVRIVISAGKQGLGKSLGVKAFLNQLPENAKGVLLNISAQSVQRGAMREYDALMKLASYHPELHIFALIEDIDALAGDRLQFAGTRKLLEIDSATSDSAPKNFHLIATTNRPDVIDPAVMRPGRTAKILVYESPKRKTRTEIARIHGEKYGFQLPDEFYDMLADQTMGFSPDEVRYILWALDFEDIKEPKAQDVARFVHEIKSRHRIEKEARKLKGKDGGNNGDLDDYDEELSDAEEELAAESQLGAN